MTPTMLADRTVLRLSGEDVRGFLQGLLTHDLRELAAGAPLWTGLLTPQGKALFDMILWSDGEDVLIDVEAVSADALAGRLGLYRLRRAITIAPAPELAVHWSLAQPKAVEGAAPDPRLAALGWRWLGQPGAATDGWPAHRLTLGVTEGVAELGRGDTLWLECNARELNGVSFAKGCYVGQENTARMHHRAKISRRLVIAPIADDERMSVAYPHFGRMVTRRRVDALGDALVPDWLVAALDL